jgi:Family of unknown function (DUF6132)
MNKRKYLQNTIPVLIGALGGFLYYTFIGCNSGTCPITGNPVISTLYGAAIGFVFTNFKRDKKQGEK